MRASLPLLILRDASSPTVNGRASIETSAKYAGRTKVFLYRKFRYRSIAQSFLRNTTVVCSHPPETSRR